MNEEAIAQYSSARLFKIWDYYISHHHLLLRSPHTRERKETIDIVFSNVGYLELPSYLDGILLTASPDEAMLVNLKRRAGREFFPGSQLFTVESGGGVFYVVAERAVIHAHCRKTPRAKDRRAAVD